MISFSFVVLHFYLYAEFNLNEDTLSAGRETDVTRTGDNVSMLDTDGLLSGFECEVLPEWIDYNGHMNVAYYVLAFDKATDALLEYLGMDAAYVKGRNNSTFVVEMNVSYLKEVHEGDRLRFTTQILGRADKKLHFYHRMYHATEGYLAATNEILMLHIDMDIRRSAPFPADIREAIEGLATAQEGAPLPDNIGRQLGI